MLELDNIQKLIEDIYPISVAALHSLQQHDLDWRGIYRVDDSEGRSWVLRVVRRQEPTSWLQQPATILRWLAANRYVAPKVLPTADGVTVGVRAQWWLLLTSYVHGSAIEPTPAELQLLGAAIAQLHRIPAVTSSHLPRSWWDCETVIPATCQRLAVGIARTPSQYRPLIRELLAAAARLNHCRLPSTMLHGDCWHAYAIRTSHDTVVLIDWDCAGLGPAVLDLGNVLLTCHYDLAAPFEVKSDEQRIAAIIKTGSARGNKTAGF